MQDVTNAPAGPRRVVWQKPQLHTEAERHIERRVSWLELFYDLVYVVVISELSHALSEHPDLNGLLSFALLFLPVWWVWIGGTYYNDRFETEDLSYRVVTFVQMLPIAAMALFAHDGTGETSTQFTLAYIAARVIIIALWLRGGWHVPEFRPVSTRYAIGFGVSVLLWLFSILVPAPQKFILWGLGLLVDFLTPITTLRYQRKLPRLNAAKLSERFGLFTIIVLGESVIGVVRGLAEKEQFTLGSGLDGLLGMALAFGLWWVYFDYVARRRARAGVWWSLTWGYLHMPLVMSLTAAGAGVLNLLSVEAGAVPDNNRWLISLAVAAALITIGAIEITLRRDAHEPTRLAVSLMLKFGAAIVALTIGFLGSGLGSLALLICLLGLVLIQMAYGAYAWFTTAPAPVSVEE